MKINLYTNKEPVFYGKKTNVNKNEIIALINQGYSYKEISTHYNHAVGWSYGIVRRLGLEHLFTEIKEKNNNEIIELRKSGLSIRKIAKKFGITFYKVAKILVENGIIITKSPNIKPRQIKAERNEKIKSDLAKGLPVKEIAQKYSLSTGTIDIIARRMDSIELKQARTRYKQEQRKNIVSQIVGDVKVGQFLDDVTNANSELKEICKNANKRSLIKEFKKQKEEKIISQIFQLAHQGYSSKEISQQLGCSQSTILFYVARSGMSLKGIRQNIMQQRIMELANAGFNLKTIAEKLDCSIQTIYNYMDKLPKTVWQREYLEQREDKIIQLYRDGVPAKQIAKLFNVSSATILRCIKKNQNKS